MNRLVMAAGLLAGAGIWVALLAATAGGPSLAPVAPQPGGVKADRAAIKFVDKANFAATDPVTGDARGEITLHLDVVDAAGQPITDLRKEDVHVAESDLPGRIQSFRGPATQPANVILVMDVSGSMAQQGRIDGARRAARAALDALKPGRDRLGLIAFDDKFDFRVPFEPLTPENRAECKRQIENLVPLKGTRIGRPVIAALKQFAEAKSDGQKMVLLMTDGDDNQRDRFERDRDQIAELSDRLGVRVYCISVGDEVSRDGEEDLRDLAAKGKGRYEHAPSPERLAELFRSRVAETVNECTLVYDSPYPTADGFDRPITVTIRTPAGPLTATASYKIGPLLSGRSKPAAWTASVPTATAGDSSSGARVAGGIRGPLFAGLFILLLAALALPGLWRKTPAAEPAPIAVLPNGPQSIRPPPPPPRIGSPSPPTAAPIRIPQAVSAPAPRPASGNVLKPPPPPPPKK